LCASIPSISELIEEFGDGAKGKGKEPAASTASKSQATPTSSKCPSKSGTSTS